MVVQLHQLDSEVLQHAQAKAERFASKGSKLPRCAHRSEVDPFADASPSGQHPHPPSGSDTDAGKLPKALLQGSGFRNPQEVDQLGMLLTPVLCPAVMTKLG